MDRWTVSGGSDEAFDGLNQTSDGSPRQNHSEATGGPALDNSPYALQHSLPPSSLAPGAEVGARGGGSGGRAGGGRGRVGFNGARTLSPQAAVAAAKILGGGGGSTGK